MSSTDNRQLISDFIEQNPKFIYWLGHKIGWRLKRRAPTQDELDDYCQEVATNMLEYSHQYDPERGAITTWAEWRMRALISRAGLKKNREILFQVTEDFSDAAGTSWDETIPGREPEPCDVVARCELLDVSAQIIQEKIMDLTPAQAWAINGNLIEGISGTELAEKRGLSTSAVSENIRYGRRNLRKSTELKRLAKLMGVC